MFIFLICECICPAVHSLVCRNTSLDHPDQSNCRAAWLKTLSGTPDTSSSGDVDSGPCLLWFLRFWAQPPLIDKNSSRNTPRVDLVLVEQWTSKASRSNWIKCEIINCWIDEGSARPLPRFSPEVTLNRIVTECDAKLFECVMATVAVLQCDVSQGRVLLAILLLIAARIATAGSSREASTALAS